MRQVAILSMLMLAFFTLESCGGSGSVSGERITRDEASPLCQKGCERFLACNPKADPIGVCMDDCFANTDRWTEPSLSAWLGCFLEQPCTAYNDDQVTDRGTGDAVAVACCKGLPRTELQQQFLDACAAKSRECDVTFWAGCGGGAVIVNDEDVKMGLGCFDKPCADAEFCLRVPMQTGSVCDPRND